jgi:predicted regulator of Ras-like GTPase activity (Roadblock/LC7/MglB family)
VRASSRAAGGPGGGSGVTSRAAAPGPRPAVFEGFDGAAADILLLDERGLVLAGGISGAGGADASELAAAALAGVSGEAARTAEYLALEAWHTIVAEADTANLVVAPVGEGALLLVRRDRSIPVGLALRFAERARGAALLWLAGQGA